MQADHKIWRAYKIRNNHLVALVKVWKMTSIHSTRWIRKKLAPPIGFLQEILAKTQARKPSAKFLMLKVDQLIGVVSVTITLLKLIWQKRSLTIWLRSPPATKFLAAGLFLAKVGKCQKILQVKNRVRVDIKSKTPLEASLLRTTEQL